MIVFFTVFYNKLVKIIKTQINEKIEPNMQEIATLYKLLETEKDDLYFLIKIIFFKGI